MPTRRRAVDAKDVDGRSYMIDTLYYDRETLGMTLFGQNDTPYGKSMQQWSNRWWNWMVGQPMDTNPTEDLKGKFANNCQTYDNVYFLCGTTKTMNNVVRNCEIPDGKSILLPVICYEHSLLEDSSVTDPLELLRLSTKDLNDYKVNDISTIIDRKEYNTNNGIIRIRSPLFRITLPKNNVWGIDKEGFTVAASDGYWLFINDIDPGSYDISVKAKPSSSNTGILEIDTTYKVHIKS